MTLSRRGRRFQRRATERRNEREAALERFGAAADDRSSDRRTARTPAETERILRDMGLTDRRRQERRRGL